MITFKDIYNKINEIDISSITKKLNLWHIGYGHYVALGDNHQAHVVTISRKGVLKFVGKDKELWQNKLNQLNEVKKDYDWSDQFIERVFYKGEVIWMHGTKKLKKILETKYLMPFLADDEEFGSACWFTADMEEAKMFGGQIIGILNSEAKKFKHKEIHSFDAKLRRQFNVPLGTVRKMGGNVVIQEKIPISKLFLVKSKTEFIPLTKLKIK